MGKKGYSYHYQKALDEWMKFNEDSAKKHNIEVDGYELSYIRDHFDEMEQVKIVYDFGRGHYFKVKWENSSWWHADPMHFYYCVMINIDNLNLLEPAVALK
jgi:hypothetical protein